MAAEVPDWLRLQKKIFSRYVEQRLKEGGTKREIVDLVEEMKSGELIFDLIQAMSGLAVKKPKEAKMRIQQIQNVVEALEFTKKAGVDLSKIRVSPEDIVDGKEQMVLAMVFQIIIKFLKFEEDDEKASIDVREALNLWLHNKTAGYAHINIKDFTKSFHDGLPFLALVHKMRPKLVDYSARSPEMKDSNLELALDLGEKYLGIPKYLTAEDIPKLNEISMIVYLSDWFSGVTLLQKQDVSARRIGKLVDVTELHDKLRADYTARATSINAWLNAKISDLGDRKFDDTLAGIKAKLAEFYAYKKAEKATKITENLDASAVFDNLAARLVNHKRPVFKPAAGLSPDELAAQFQLLEEAETKRSEALHAEHARQIHLGKLYRRFQGNTAKLQAWSAEKDSYLQSSPTINSVEDAEDALDALGIFEGELKHISSSSLADLSKLGAELVAERFEHSADVKSSESSLTALFAGIATNSASKRVTLQAALQAQKDLNDSLYKAFGDAINEFNSWIKSQRESLNADSKKELEVQLESLSAFTGQAGAAEAKLAGIEASDQKIQARELVNNPYTNLSLADAQSQWSSFLVLVNKKEQLLKEQIEEKKRGGLTPEQQKEIHDNFVYFDKDNNGFLNKKELRTCLQSLGEESTPKDVERIFSEYDKGGAGNITRGEFERLMRDSMGDSDTEAEIVKAFGYLSYEAPEITSENLVNVVNNRSFTDHHVEYLTKEMPAKGAGFDYTAWTQAAFAR